MFKIVDKNGVNAVFPKYIAKCTTTGSGNIFAGKAKATFVVDDIQTIENIIAATKTAYAGKPLESTQKFGEVISLVSEATNEAVVTITGKDYLGQIMVEKITLNSATAVSGKKAFKIIESLTVASASAKDVDLKTVNKVGLEFNALSIDNVAKNGVADATIAVTAGAYTQTATSKDTRGTLDISSGSAGDVVDVVYNVTDYVASDEGGLFGVPHYAG